MWFVNNPALDRWAICFERGLYYYGWLPGVTEPVPLGIWNPAQVFPPPPYPRPRLLAPATEPAVLDERTAVVRANPPSRLNRD